MARRDDVNYLALDSLRDPLEYIMADQLGYEDLYSLGRADRRLYGVLGGRIRALQEDVLDATSTWLSELRKQAESDEWIEQRDARNGLEALGLKAPVRGSASLRQWVQELTPRSLASAIRSALIKASRQGSTKEVYRKIAHLGKYVPYYVLRPVMLLTIPSLAEDLYDYEISSYERLIDEAFESSVFHNMEDEDIAFSIMNVLSRIGRILERGSGDKEELWTYIVPIRLYIQQERLLSPTEDEVMNMLKENAEDILSKEWILPISKTLHRQPPFMRGPYYPEL